MSKKQTGHWPPANSPQRSRQLDKPETSPAEKTKPERSPREKRETSKPSKPAARPEEKRPVETPSKTEPKQLVVLVPSAARDELLKRQPFGKNGATAAAKTAREAVRVGTKQSRGRGHAFRVELPNMKSVEALRTAAAGAVAYAQQQRRDGKRKVDPRLANKACTAVAERCDELLAGGAS